MTDQITSNLGTVTVNESCDLLDLSCHFSAFGDFLFSFVLWAYESILFGLAALFEAIPVPDFLQNAMSYKMPNILGWFAEPFAISTGATIIVSAYVLRFIIRRLPFVG